MVKVIILNRSRINVDNGLRTTAINSAFIPVRCLSLVQRCVFSQSLLNANCCTIGPNYLSYVGPFSVGLKYV